MSLPIYGSLICHIAFARDREADITQWSSAVCLRLVGCITVMLTILVMENQMKKTILATLAALSFASPMAHAGDKSDLAVGFGIGIPYGVIGANFEYMPIRYLSFTAGAGYSPGGMGWAVGGRLYPLTTEGKIRPYLAAYHGVVAILETISWPGDSTYENITGNAYGGGLSMRLGSGDVMVELLGTSFTYPAGTTESGSNVKLGLGYRIRF